jgi:anthranilate phosphoribosyltransferase
VYSKEMAKPLAEVLARLGTKRLIAVHGEDGLDEVSPAGNTYCVEIFDGKTREYTLTPADFGLKAHDKKESLGGDPAENATILRGVVGGEKGAYRDAVVMNSGLCFYIAGKVKSPYEGAKLAEEVIDSGKAAATLVKYINATNKFRA